MNRKNLLLTLFIVPSFVFAQMMKLDSTFNSTGIVTKIINNKTCLSMEELIQPDGKLVITGQASGSFAMFRLHANGTPDASFGLNGTVTTSVPGSAKSCSIALQTDGKIVMTGTVNNKFAILRYNSNGSIDSTFNSTGIDTFSLHGSSSQSQCGKVLIQSDGKIVAAGCQYIFAQFSTEYFVIRYNSNGRPDSTFGISGFASVNFGCNSYVSRTPLLLQPDGKIILGNMTCGDTITSHDFALARFLSNGFIDSSFGNNGIVKTDFGGTTESLFNLKLQSDGKIISIGTSENIGALARNNVNGTPDSTFGIQGRVTFLGGGVYTFFTAGALQTDGKLLVTGADYGTADSMNELIIARYNTDGSLDSTFANNGLITVRVDSVRTEGSDIVIQNDGKLVVAGFGAYDSAILFRFIVLRYLADLSVGEINFQETENNLLIYPNPVHDFATLEYSLSREENVSIYLSDMNGKTVAPLIAHQRRESGSHKEDLYLPDYLPAGIYCLVISNGKGIMQIKIYKQ